jgi:hypothetical protein
VATRGGDFTIGAAAFDVSTACACVTGGGVARISRNLNSRVSGGAYVAFGDAISVTGANVVFVGLELVVAIAVAVGEPIVTG